jgi:hypothetical protein
MFTTGLITGLFFGAVFTLVVCYLIGARAAEEARK